MSAFTDYVNSELPKRIGFGTLPAGGNATAGKYPKFTGTGLTIEESVLVTLPKKTVYVSSTDEDATYTTLNAALAAVVPLSDSEQILYEIQLDQTEIHQLSDVSPAVSTTAYILIKPRVGYSINDTQTEKTAAQINFYTNTGTPSYIISRTVLIFENIYFGMPWFGNTSVTTGENVCLQYGYSTSVFFKDCKIVGYNFNIGATTVKLAKGQATAGNHIYFLNSSLTYGYLSGYSSVGFEHNLIDFSMSDHSGLHIIDSEIQYGSGNLTNENVTFCKLSPSTYVAGYLEIVNSIMKLPIKSTFTATAKWVTSGNDNSNYDNIIRNNIFRFYSTDSAAAGSTVIAFTYNTLSNAGVYYSQNNIYRNISNAVNSLTLHTIDTGDTCYSVSDTFEGTIVESAGAGTYVSNSFVATSPYTPTTSAHWDGDPATIQDAIDRIAAAVSGLLSGPIP